MGGADHIKICSSGGVMSLTDTVDSEQFTIEEIKAICDTVRKMVRSLSHFRGTLLTDRAERVSPVTASPARELGMPLKRVYGVSNTAI